MINRIKYNNDKNKRNKIDIDDIPKLSLNNLQHGTGTSGTSGGGGNRRYEENEVSPPLHKRDLDKIDKGYPRINDIHSHSHQNLSNNNNNNSNNSNKFGGSGKYPPIAKTSEHFSESFQDDMNYITKSRDQRDQRKIGNKLPPRELKPISYTTNDNHNNNNNNNLNLNLNNGNYNNSHNNYNHQSALIPGHKSQSQRLPSLSRSHGPGSLQPLNPMLKSSSLSKIEQDDPINKHLSESSNRHNHHKKALAPLNHSNRNLQPVQSTRPW